jgi:ketosteroid isomerase-like protein
MRHLAIPFLLLVGACQVQKTGEHAPVTEAEALKAAQATEATYSGGDAARIAAQYAPTAVAFDAGHVDASSDPKVLAGWAGEFVSMSPGDFEIANRRIQITGPDSFVNSGVARFTVAAGQARPQVGVRMTQVYQRQSDGSWKIAHEHMSMPPAPSGQAAQ